MPSLLDWILNSPDEEPKEEFLNIDGRKRPQVRYQTAKEWHGKLWDARRSQSDQLDSLIITLSSASLALSIGFLKDFVKSATAVQLPLLILSWTLFGLSIISTLLSFWAARKDLDVEVKIYRQYLYPEDQSVSEADLWKRCTQQKNNWRPWVDRANALAAIAFITALVSTIIFVSANLIDKQQHAPAPPDKIEKGS